MIRIFCDGKDCGKELSDRYNKVEVPYHITRPISEAGYVDNDMNRVSGHTVSYQLCNECSNRFYYAAFDSVFER